MFKQAEIIKMDRIRDESGNITRLINRISVHDDTHGILYSEVICECEDLKKILAAPQEEQPKLFQEWITPKIQEVYNPWFEAKEKDKSDSLFAKDIEEKFGVPPVITSL